MSFYQPSLSLYDVLNALNEQNRSRYQQQRSAPAPPLNRGHIYPHPHPHPHHFPPHAHRHGPTVHPVMPRPAPNPHHMFQAPFSFFDRDFGQPGSYFYNVPGQGYYYSPQYDYNDSSEDEQDEDDEANDLDLEHEQTEKWKDKERDEEKKEKKQEIPSYYHSKGPQNRKFFNNESNPLANDPFANILSQILGNQPSFYDYDAEENESTGNETNPEENKEYAPEKDKTELEKSSDAVEDKDSEKATSENAEKDTSEIEPASRPKAENKFPSQAHLRAPSPIPDPLQVSKPETRLDLPFSPEVNAYDLEDKYVVVLSLPGANSKSFKIDFHPSSHELLIKGNIIDRLGISEKYLKFTEIKYGAFERTVKFPVLPRIKDEEIKAKYANGLLQITVPKLEETKLDKHLPKKRITIEDVPDVELEFEKNPNPVEKI